ncbi:Fic family protein MloA [Olavius algarvensis Delta 1 endosymbiont]|nr:Fic family protein MloA [Olavius algarvensis Delta 1 endosymbiont]
MVFSPDKPFNDLPLLPPKAEIETRVTLKKTISAGRALAELKGLGETIPNQALLVNSIILQEAKASSEIENIITTHDALFRAFSAKTSQIDPATKEVLRYREALWEGFSSLKDRPLLTTNLFIRIVQTIRANKAGIRNTPGTKVANATTGEVVFTPPEGEDIIRNKLKNLEDYIHAEDTVDPLMKLALIHYQFEAIHPFTDGNGRTGRILNILYLTSNQLLDLPVLYLSKYIIEHKSDYYRLLRGVTCHQEWEPWILFMLDAVEQTAIHTRDKIFAIRELLIKTLEITREKLPARVYSKDLIELLFHQPYTKGQFLVDAGLVKRQAAADYLKRLEELGVLSSHKVGRENLYLNTKLYEILSK